ncbi:MAG: alpha-L-fucosidase [Lachnospiraceae bacterium]|nr:alpha-L-fucosidase [Lachnospiraceae bacterium]
MTPEQKYLELVEKGIAEGPFSADWASLSRMRTPGWFDENRLGIFTHWGIYSVPAHANEWYSRNMYRQGDEALDHHRKTYGAQRDFGYKDFIPQFTAERFDADEWLSLFKEAGAGYYFPVAEHHDGFQMYDSELSEWCAGKKGPKRDVLGELRAAAEREGIHFCASSHRAEHWFFMGVGKEFDSDIKEPLKKGDFYWPSMPDVNFEDRSSTPMPTEEYLNDWLARTAEIIVKYRPELLYFDWWIQHEAFIPYLKKLAAFYYNCGVRWGQDVSICYKLDAFAFGSGIFEVERGGLSDQRAFRWQTDTAAARNSWCYTDSLIYKPVREIIINLADAVSKNGNLLLNIGPKADGTIADGDRKILTELGAWMRTNSEAINGARPWRKAQEGPTVQREGQFTDVEELVYTPEDFRFTVNNGNLYAICLKCPENGEFTIRSMRDSFEQEKRDSHLLIEAVDVLGFDGRVEWHADEEALHVSAPGLKSDTPVTIRIRTR